MLVLCLNLQLSNTKMALYTENHRSKFYNKKCVILQTVYINLTGLTDSSDVAQCSPCSHKFQ